LQLTIEKLVYGGDGLARGPAGDRGSGQAVFMPFVLAGERVQVRTVEEKPGFVRARADKILQPSPERVDPRCPYFAECGGCHYQHAAYEHQLQIKTAILRETLQRIAQVAAPPIEYHPSLPWQYRNRTRMKVHGGADFALGYHRFHSNDLLPVEHCPISSPLINRAIAAVWQLGRAGRVNDVLLNIEFFANASDNQLLVELTLPDQYWTRASKPSLLEFIGELRQLLPEIAGVAAFRVTAEGPLVREEVPGKLKDVFGANELAYDTGGCEYHVSAGSFFQTNRYLIDTLLALVTEGQAGEAALDLYAGTGLFTLPLSQTFRQVTAVEAAPFSFHDLKRNSPSNVNASRETTEDFLRRVGESTASPFDLVIVDPPRGGLGEKTAAALSQLAAPFITYVSCDPATLARDLKVLLAKGFRIQQMHLVDLFPQTFHIESVTKLVR
jgi:23S rRNA (uracil1939-C5)-methyltransferase